MNSLKTFISSLLLLLVVCQAANANTSTTLPVYVNIIADTSIGYENDMLTGTIQLENGCIMRIVDYKTRDDNVMKTWHAGDAVAFKAHVYNEALILSVKRISGPNENRVEPYVIFDVINSSKGSLKIVEINDEGQFVKLSDNSVWEFSWFNRLSSKHWKLGERVLVNGNGDKNSYDFINLDAPVTKNVASANASFVVH